MAIPESSFDPQDCTPASSQRVAAAMPRIGRTPIAPRMRAPRRAWSAGAADESQPPSGARDDSRLRRSAAVRRWGLLLLVVAQTWIATDYMTTVLPYQGRQPLELGILGLFAFLFAWISAGFWTGLAGFFLLLSGRDRYAVSAAAGAHAPIGRTTRTAVVMPICNEDVPRVFAGLRATYESLARTGELARFDFFVLSDSSDPDTRIAEQCAWRDLCAEVGGVGRVFYRWRKHRIKRKSGNVADFCRRWGSAYRYMVVLDADSVMTGEALVRLVGMMEAHPRAGIIQTIPRAAGRETLHARIQQFASSVYGPVFAAGLHFWQLSESHYWGHNAIIRLEPFMRHCALGRLPGRGLLAGEILSHDFVEAALMRRAGYGVWIAYDLPGSYEEMPPNLLDEVKRDRRWCQGNLMNFKLVGLKGLHAVHRVVFATGVIAYASAPLWLMTLVLSTTLLTVHAMAEPVYFVEPYQLFPSWPAWHPERAIALFSTTLTLLVLPKLLSIPIAIRRGAGAFGSRLLLAASVLAEIVASTLLAPVRMLFHTHFVLAALAGRTVQWKSPPRADVETSWSEAWQRHGWQSALGAAWTAVLACVETAHVWWFLPVAGAMMLSVPMSVLMSRASLGKRLRALGLFLVPEETGRAPEIERTASLSAAAQSRAYPGFVRSVLDPAEQAHARALAPHGHAGARRDNPELLRRALEQGPEALEAKDRMALLNDARLLAALHAGLARDARALQKWRASARASLPASEHSPVQSSVGGLALEGH